MEQLYQSNKSNKTTEQRIMAGESDKMEERLGKQYGLQAGLGFLDQIDREQWRRHMNNINYMSLRKRQNLIWANSVVKEGRKLAQNGNMAEAFKKYQQALQISPNCSEAFIARADGYFQHRRYVEAQREYKKAQELDTSNEHIKRRLDTLSRIVTAAMLKSHERERQQSPMATSKSMTTPSNPSRVAGQPASATRVGSTASKTKYALNSSITMVSKNDLIMPEPEELLAQVTGNDVSIKNNSTTNEQDTITQTSTAYKNEQSDHKEERHRHRHRRHRSRSRSRSRSSERRRSHYSDNSSRHRKKHRH
ncbi:hypothetical protein BDF22DRAFT_60629 [Syncephalis plumigaleata]|nr:hypothetical protein BDF22DRAFT_60629 [Syncephalis plumigaleata]